MKCWRKNSKIHHLVFRFIIVGETQKSSFFGTRIFHLCRKAQHHLTEGQHHFEQRENIISHSFGANEVALRANGTNFIWGNASGFLFSFSFVRLEPKWHPDEPNEFLTGRKSVLFFIPKNQFRRWNCPWYERFLLHRERYASRMSGRRGKCSRRYPCLRFHICEWPFRLQACAA